MRKKKIHQSILCFLLGFSMLFTMAETANAQAITTPVSELPLTSNQTSYEVTVNASGNRKLTYKVFSQSQAVWGKNSYISTHGCAVCALTTILTGYTEKFKNYTPAMTSQILEKKVFGSSTWRRNYRQSQANQMPVSLYGITKVLRYAGIKTKYVRRFKNASAVKAIENHLKSGRPVIIEVNNHTQVNGRFSSRYNQKWALTKHTMALLGMTDNGKVIVADSADRAWSKARQRVKYVTMSSLVRFMIPCTSSNKSCYYQSMSANGGYVLVQ